MGLTCDSSTGKDSDERKYVRRASRRASRAQVAGIRAALPVVGKGDVVEEEDEDGRGERGSHCRHHGAAAAYGWSGAPADSNSMSGEGVLVSLRVRPHI